MNKAYKKIKAVTGIVCFLYFLTAIIIDAVSWQPSGFVVYALLFPASWPYNAFCTFFPNSHFMRYLCQFIVFLVVWYLVFLFCRAVYEMLEDIYLDKKRFRDINKHRED